MDIEQNEAEFTGERLVINKKVKQSHANVLEEHVERYRLACDFAKGKTVLDAACGAGYGSYMLAQAGALHVTGVDISDETISGARETYNLPTIEFVMGDVNALPFEDRAFDMIVSFETLEHIENGVRWVEESARLLKPGGIFIVSTPNRTVTNPGSRYEEQPLNRFHRHECSVYEFLGILLKNYDIMQLYGQSFFCDTDFFLFSLIRQIRSLAVDTPADTGTDTAGNRLIPFTDVKNAVPVYMTAVGRKKDNSMAAFQSRVCRYRSDA